MSLTNTKRCIKCILPESFPGISFNQYGVCIYCTESLTENELMEQRKKLKELMEKEIENKKDIGEYDCIVAFSGGKDSSFTLMQLVRKYKLNCLAVTINNDFLSDQAVKNCYKVTEALGVDFLFFKPAPSFMKNLYKTSILTGGIQSQSALKRASSVCNSCINLINNYMIKIALLHKAPFIAGGYIGGQVPSNAYMLNLNLIQKESIKKSFAKKYTQLFGERSSKFFFIREDLIDQNQKSDITVINPMLTISLKEEEIIDSIKELGWEMSNDTGKNSSNCKLNDLGIAVHFKKHSFHPYELEVAEQVRNGFLSREDALKKINDIPEFSTLTEHMDKIGITLNEIR